MNTFIVDPNPTDEGTYKVTVNDDWYFFVVEEVLYEISKVTKQDLEKYSSKEQYFNFFNIDP